MGVIFISHSSRNNAEAVAVRDWLRGEGYAETFLDLDPQHGLAPGQRWEEELQKAGERCLAVVVLISPEWCASKWCFHEFKFAKALGKKIFPVLAQPTSFADIPPELTSQFQMADISSPDRYQDGLIRLRIGLQRAGLDPKHFVLPEGRPPYRGLKALEEEDAAIFFGRDAQITAGLDALRQMRSGTPQRILTIAAASGAGKSSFLKAGLLARLKRDEENFLVLPTWRPGRDALDGETGLARALGAATPQPALDKLAAAQSSVIERFQAMATAAHETWRGTPPTLVLPLDQAEELFSADNSTSAAATDLLLSALAAKPDLVVVATIRSDALGMLQADNRLAEQLRLFNLPALPPSAFREVIEGPARLADPPITVEHALTDRLIEDLDKADALPLLAFTLERLVTEHGADRELNLQDYVAGLGGIGGAINAAVEAALRKAEADPGLPSARHELDSLARAAFIPWLVQLDEADANPRRRVARLHDLPPGTHPLIRHFVEERLLVAQELSGQTVIEVSHEAVLRHWRGLAAWISEERIVLERLQRVQRASREWASDIRGQNRADMLVHRGERLKLAEELLGRPDLAPLLEDSGAAYLEECRKAEDARIAEAEAQAAREASQRRRTGRWQAMAALVLVAGFAALTAAGVFLVNERRSYGKAQSLMLARVAGQFEAAGDHPRSLALSILASRKNFLSPASPEAFAAFASASQSAKQTLAVRHEGPVSGAIFSPDESRILTWSEDKTAGLWNAATGARLGAALLHEGPVSGGVFSREGNRILTWSSDSTARLWNAANGEQIGPALQHADFVTGALFSSDGSRILTWSEDNTARLWDAASGAQIGPALKHDSWVTGAAFSKDETRIVTWSGDQTVRLWDTATSVQLGPALKHEGWVSGALFSNDQTRILTWSDDNTARLWDVATGAQIGPAFRHEDWATGAAFSSDETRILTWSEDKTARLWNAATGAQIGPALTHEDWVSGAVFSKDETRILTWSGDMTARIWDAMTGDQIGTTLKHEGPVWGAIFSNDEARILTWSSDGTARLWDAASGTQVGPALKHEKPVYGAAFSKDETRILTWGEDNTARLWDARIDSQAGPAIKHTAPVYGALFSGDEARILTWSEDNTVRLWNAATSAQIGPAFRHDSRISGAVFTRDETRILSWSDDKAARLWNTSTGAQIGTDLQHDNWVYGAAFSPDETRILTWSEDSTARLWDAATSAPAGPALKHEERVRGAAFSQDATRILTWSDDKTARLWDAATGAQAGPPLQHEDWVSGAVFSKDETRILTWSEDKTARLWNAATGAQIGPAFKHEEGVFGAIFSKDEHRILTRSGDNTARLWDTATGGQIGPALRHDNTVYGAVFSEDEMRILTWSEDFTARLWDASNGTQIGPSLKHEGAVYGARFSADEARILTWGEDRTARLWDAATGAQIGPAFRHGRWVSGADFSKDEARILTWSGDGTVRIWDARRAMVTNPDERHFKDMCETSLRGSPAATSNGEMAPFPRLIDAQMVESAPILRGREGEDVCRPRARPPWEHPFQAVLSFISPN